MEQMLQDVPEDKRDLYKDSDMMRVILAFDHMDQEQAQRFYVRVSEQVGTRSRRLVRICLEEVLCYNTSLLSEIEKMAVGILMDGGSRQMANI